MKKKNLMKKFVEENFIKKSLVNVGPIKVVVSKSFLVQLKTILAKKKEMGKNLSKKILVSNNFVPQNYGHKNICLIKFRWEEKEFGQENVVKKIFLH